MKKYWILAIITLVAIGGIRLAAVYAEPSVPEVQVIRIREEEYTEHFSVNGVVESPSTRELAPSYPFVPEKVLVEEGDAVEFGQLIAVIDPEETAKALASAAKEYADFLPDGLIPDEAEEVFSQIGAESLTELDGFSLELRAPMSGVLTSVNLTEGQLYLPTAPAAAVSSMTSLRVRLSVPENKVGLLRVGQELTFQTPAIEDGLFGAKITRISPTAVQKLDGINYQTVVEVTARIDDDFGVLRPGYSVQADIPAGDAEKMDLLPYEAVLRDDNGTDYVYVLLDGKAVRRDIETGKELSTAVEVTSGLGKYEAVILDAGALSGEGAVQLADAGVE